MRSLKDIFMFMAIVALFGATVVSCNHHEREYGNWVDLPVEGWAYNDTVSLLVVDTTLVNNDSIVNRPLLVGLTHSNDYLYSNLWLELTYHGANATYRDTINIPLADVYGRWLGKGFGASYQHEIVVNPAADVDITRPATIRHIMRVDTLIGLDRVGVSVR